MEYRKLFLEKETTLLENSTSTFLCDLMKIKNIKVQQVGSLREEAATLDSGNSQTLNSPAQ